MNDKKNRGHVKRKFSDLLSRQEEFSNSCFSSENFTESEKIEKHKTFCLALHGEVSQLASSVHYKDHHQKIEPTNRQQILYESVDVIRYALATLNLWGFSSDDFADAFDARDASLWDRKNRSLSHWSGQPVAIIDVDDVLARFREVFFNWLNENFGLTLSTEIPEYYYNGPAGDLTAEEAFKIFIDQGGFRGIEPNLNVVSSLKKLKEKGYWIQLLTARPEDNVKCMYDTYLWLDKLSIPYHNLAFSFEKYRWLTDKEFFKKKKIAFAVDDSPKHAAEFAAQGIVTYVPRRSYNSSIWETDNIITFDWEKDDISELV